ncbi:MAG: glycosyltransferase family 1 protein [Candidatus Binataceae bacterium]|jgi:glycosyltransferase involved in cell wall biosynthesis
MRIAFDARSLASPVLRGWDRYLVGLAGELVQQGIEVTLLHRAREPLHRRHIADLGCEVVGLEDFGGLHWEQVAVPLALWRRRVDLFHAPAEHGVPFGAMCPVVLTIHSVTEHSFRDLIEQGLLGGKVRDYLGKEAGFDDRRLACWYWRAQVARANQILCPSEYCRDEVIRFLGRSPNRVTTTPLAVHQQFRSPPNALEIRARTLLRLGICKPYLLYVGGFETHKNVGGLLEAFALAHAAQPELSLVVVGSKALPESIVEHATRLRLRPGRDIIFLVNVTEDLADLYDEAELLVTLSWRETFCLPALEAMTRGIPVVASAWGGAREVVGDAGRLVDPRDSEAAKNAIEEMLAVKNRAGFAASIRARAARFTWAATAAQTLEVYRSLIGRRSEVSAAHSTAA